MTAENSADNKSFTFDFCYGPASEQQEVYVSLGEPLVNKALEGYNGTIFAYGQTGSGKTHSMMGSLESQGDLI